MLRKKKPQDENIVSASATHGGITNKTQVRLPPTTSGLETEWDYSGRKGRDGQKKKIGKVNEKREKGKVKRAKDEEVNGQGGKQGKVGVPAHTKE